MKQLFTFKRFKLYAWIGLAFLALEILTDLSEPRSEFGGRILNNCWAVIYVTLLNFFFFEYVLPRLGWKKFGQSLLLLFTIFFLGSLGLYIWRSIGIHLHIYTPFGTYSSVGENVGDRLGFSIQSIIFFSIIRFIYNHNKLKRAARQLRIEKQEAELNYLKSQTNPHFLFNTLNNIYSLARDKSDLAPDMILKLSKMLRYMLYEAGGSFIAIGQELKIIGDYIALEKLRYDDSLRINFNYNVEDMHQSLPPLLLMPLVENAFKHGVSETRIRPFIDIHLSVGRQQLTFQVRNSTEDIPAGTTVKENIGLSNLRRQLELLYTDYTLALEQRPAEFSATLHINLASHV